MKYIYVIKKGEFKLCVNIDSTAGEKPSGESQDVPLQSHTYFEQQYDLLFKLNQRWRNAKENQFKSKK